MKHLFYYCFELCLLTYFCWKIKQAFVVIFFTYLDLKKTNLFGQDRKRIMISMVNQALQTHSTKKNASWALVWYLSNVQAVELKEVRTVIFLITGTRISGWVLRQKETIDTTIKNTEMIPITWNVLRKKFIISSFNSE